MLAFYHLLLASHFDLNQVTVLAACVLNTKILNLVLIVASGSVIVNLNPSAAERPKLSLNHLMAKKV
jgi:hypothetical protein